MSVKIATDLKSALGHAACRTECRICNSPALGSPRVSAAGGSSIGGRVLLGAGGGVPGASEIGSGGLAGAAGGWPGAQVPVGTELTDWHGIRIPNRDKVRWDFIGFFEKYGFTKANFSETSTAKDDTLNLRRFTGSGETGLKGITAQTIYRLMSCNELFDFENIDQFRDYISIRTWIAAEGKAEGSLPAAQRAIRFPGAGRPATLPSGWTAILAADGEGVFPEVLVDITDDLLSGESLMGAVFNGSPGAVVGCNLATMFVMIRGLEIARPDIIRNALLKFKGKTREIGLDDHENVVRLREDFLSWYFPIESVSDSDKRWDWIPGDSGAILNIGATESTPEPQLGENFVYVGGSFVIGDSFEKEGKFYNNPGGVVPLQNLIDHVRSWPGGAGSEVLPGRRRLNAKRLLR